MKRHIHSIRAALRGACSGALLLTALGPLSSCAGPVEGERCNPALFQDACGAGTTCTYPTNCGVAYCCPAKITATTSANCMACPGADAGTSD